MPQVQPDWSMVGRYPKQIEAALGNFKFSGPGFYLSDTDTLLVTPNTADVTDWPMLWKQSWAVGTTFNLFVWNCPFHETIFACIAMAPVRLDTRESVPE